MSTKGNVKWNRPGHQAAKARALRERGWFITLDKSTLSVRSFPFYGLVQARLLVFLDVYSRGKSRIVRLFLRYEHNSFNEVSVRVD